MNPRNRPVRLHEEVLLIALRDDRGTVDHRAGSYTFAMAGGILSELLFERRIELTADRRPFVTYVGGHRVGDPLLDECLDRIRDARRRARLSAWVSRFAGLRGLKQRVAADLCRMGILQEHEDQVLLFFTRKVYPTCDPRYEAHLRERLRGAIFMELPRVELRTKALVALARGANLLGVIFPRRELREHRRRIEELCKSEALGDATGTAVHQAVQEACAAASAAALAACC